jgi:hypothetical protein
MIAHTPRAKHLALVLQAMTQFVIVIDASIVNVDSAAGGHDRGAQAPDRAGGDQPRLGLRQAAGLLKPSVVATCARSLA